MTNIILNIEAKLELKTLHAYVVYDREGGGQVE